MIVLLTFFAILSVLVLVHESGHFLAAKKAGILVEEFGFGFPPRLFSKKIGETVYSLNLLLFGGFVKLYGEEGVEVERGLRPRLGRAQVRGKRGWEQMFVNKNRRQRAGVILAGVLANFLLAWLIVSFVFTQGVMAPGNKVRVVSVAENSPAEKAGIQVKDQISKIKYQKSNLQIKNQKCERDRCELEIQSPEDLIAGTKEHLGEEMELEIKREKTKSEPKYYDDTYHQSEKDEEVLIVKITPRKEYPGNEGPMGIAVSNLEEKRYPWWQAPFLGMVESAGMTGAMFLGLGQIIWRLVSLAEVPKDIAGPVGIAHLTGEAVKYGGLAVLQFTGLLSLNLAVINILPFPALDGGRLIFIAAERFISKDKRIKWEKRVNYAGIAMLMVLMILITLNDLRRLFNL